MAYRSSCVRPATSPRSTCHCSSAPNLRHAAAAAAAGGRMGSRWRGGSLQRNSGMLHCAAARKPRLVSFLGHSHACCSAPAEHLSHTFCLGAMLEVAHPQHRCGRVADIFLAGAGAAATAGTHPRRRIAGGVAGSHKDHAAAVELWHLHSAVQAAGGAPASGGSHPAMRQPGSSSWMPFTARSTACSAHPYKSFGAPGHVPAYSCTADLPGSRSAPPERRRRWPGYQTAREHTACSPS